MNNAINQLSTLLRTDWQLFSDTYYSNIRDDSFEIIYTNEGDYLTAKQIFRSREMHTLLTIIKESNELSPELNQLVTQLLKDIAK